MFIPRFVGGGCGAAGGSGAVGGSGAAGGSGAVGGSGAAGGGVAGGGREKDDRGEQGEEGPAHGTGRRRKIDARTGRTRSGRLRTAVWLVQLAGTLRKSALHRFGRPGAKPGVGQRSRCRSRQNQSVRERGIET